MRLAVPEATGTHRVHLRLVVEGAGPAADLGLYVDVSLIPRPPTAGD